MHLQGKKLEWCFYTWRWYCQVGLLKFVCSPAVYLLGIGRRVQGACRQMTS